MSGKAAKRAIEQKKKAPKAREFVLDSPHVFRVKSDQSLAHLQETRQFLPCSACSQETDRRENVATQRAVSSRRRKPHLPPTSDDLERLSRPKSVPPVRTSTNCNWENFIRHRSKYAIQSPYAFCDPLDGQEHSETRPPFINYGGRYEDKQRGEKRTFNALAIHQLKHHEVEETRLIDTMQERRLRLQAEKFLREMEERKARAQEIRDRDARVSTEYRDNFRAPADYQGQRTFARH